MNPLQHLLILTLSLNLTLSAAEKNPPETNTKELIEQEQTENAIDTFNQRNLTRLYAFITSNATIFTTMQVMLNIAKESGLHIYDKFDLNLFRQIMRTTFEGFNENFPEINNCNLPDAFSSGFNDIFPETTHGISKYQNDGSGAEIASDVFRYIGWATAIALVAQQTLKHALFDIEKLHISHLAYGAIHGLAFLGGAGLIELLKNEAQICRQYLWSMLLQSDIVSLSTDDSADVSYSMDSLTTQADRAWPSGHSYDIAYMLGMVEIFCSVMKIKSRKAIIGLYAVATFFITNLAQLRFYAGKHRPSEIFMGIEVALFNILMAVLLVDALDVFYFNKNTPTNNSKEPLKIEAKEPENNEDKDTLDNFGYETIPL